MNLVAQTVNFGDPNGEFGDPNGEFGDPNGEFDENRVRVFFTFLFIFDLKS